MKFRHISLRYLWDRSQVWLYEKRYPDRPWLTPKATDIIENFLKPSHVVVEWGSGRSTLWLARRVGHITSIEGNLAWYAKVKNELEMEGLNNVDYRLI